MDFAKLVKVNKNAALTYQCAQKGAFVIIKEAALTSRFLIAAKHAEKDDDKECASPCSDRTLKGKSEAFNAR